MKPSINVIMPPDFKDKLKEYLANIRTRDNEYDKRSYMSNKLMTEILGIKPEFIEFEKDRVDLYFAGVLFETKTELKREKVIKGLSEIEDYLKKRPNTAEAVITDGITFYFYEDLDMLRNDANPETLYNTLKKKVFTLESSLDNLEYQNVESHIFQKLYLIFYPRLKFKKIEEDVIAPRLIKLVEELSITVKVKNEIKFRAWKNFLSVAIGSSNNETSEDLYKRYVVLYYLTTLMVAKVMGINGNVSDLISPAAYATKGIINFIEDDSIFAVLDEKSEVIKEIEEELDLYDFTNTQGISEEVYRLLYEHLINPSERHDLGEFYTPTWLASILVNEAIKTGNETILDPSCGSGTFVRLALKRIKELCGTGHIIGFDINPIAVHIARANYLTERPNEKIIPVFLADSLMPGLKLTNTNQTSLDQLGEVKIDFDSIIGEGGLRSFFYRTDLSFDEINKYVQNMMDLTEDKNSKIPEEYLENKELIRTISKLKAQNKNHVWGFILKNMYTPYYMRRKADVIIGNPPWLTYHAVGNPKRQEMLDELYEAYNMKAGSRNKTHQDMSGFFICRSFEYLKNGNGDIYFVITRSIMNGDQYHGLRTGAWNNLAIQAGKDKNIITISKIWDIERTVNPFNKPSCMVEFHTGSTSVKIHGYIIAPNKDNFDKKKIIDNIEISRIPKEFYVNISPNYSGISIERYDFGKEVSPYRDKFYNGATIFPRSYFFIKLESTEKYGSIVSTQEKYTSEANRRTKKGSYSAFFDHNSVPNELIFSVLLGENINKFYADLSKKAVIPIYSKNGHATSVVNKQQSKGIAKYQFTLNPGIIQSRNTYEKEALKSLYQAYVKKFNEFELDWENQRGDKFNTKGKTSAKMSLWDNLDYIGKLISQDPFSEKLAVVYNESGTSIRCVVIKSKGVIFEHKTYYYYASSENEAYYLAGILNSQRLISILKSSGILAERDIEKKVFEVNIPLFDGKNSLHNEISLLSKQISESLENGEKLEDQNNQQRLESIEKAVSKII